MAKHDTETMNLQCQMDKQGTKEIRGLLIRSKQRAQRIRVSVRLESGYNRTGRNAVSQHFSVF